MYEKKQPAALRGRRLCGNQSSQLDYRASIPCLTRGGPTSTFPGVYEAVDEEIDRMSKEEDPLSYTGQPVHGDMTE
jgi:hypothetical protein